MNRSKKWLAAILAGLMAASLTGCGSSGQTEGSSGRTGETDGAGGTESGDTAMGRYMESSQTLDIGKVTDLVTLADGRLELLEDGSEGRYLSSDGGVTWEEAILPGWYDLVMQAYVLDMKGAPDGSVAILCHDYNIPVGEEEADGGQETAREEADAAQEAAGDDADWVGEDAG
ncbi:MAG: YgdI/YgdR family lipoprotein, partial [Lachnospiraceae bacterium]